MGPDGLDQLMERAMQAARDRGRALGSWWSKNKTGLPGAFLPAKEVGSRSAKGQEMQADKTDFDRLCEALWAQLGEQGWARVSVDEAAVSAGLPAEATWQAGSKLSLILSQLRQMEAAWLAALAGDLAEDAEASIQEKLLEGLMQRFEFLAAPGIQFDGAEPACDPAAPRQP